MRSELDGNTVVYYRYDSTAAFVPTNTWANFTAEQGDDEREVIRLDADWYAGDHSVRFGVDYEKLTSNSNTIYSGGAY